ncbi:MAG: hypothetical protein JRC86_00450 [Deltaproteobacteria bacterium]|nr:hypothetical protein [Deltaproteobacteria bacterium]
MARTGSEETFRDGAQDGADIAGAVVPTGGWGIRGWLSALYTKFAAAIESNGAVAVNIQDQHTRALDLKFIQQVGAPTTVASNITVGDTTVSMTADPGFIAGRVVGIFTATGDFYFAEVISSSGTGPYAVVLDTPVDFAFPSGSTVIAASHHLNVNGSLGSPEIFQVGPVGGATGVEIDITRIMGMITDSAAMDDGKFGSLNALTNGCVLRQNNGAMTNIWNVKTNGDIGLICFDGQYTEKAPAGENGFRFRNTYGGQAKHGVTIRLEPGDILELLVQDNLSTLSDFQIMAQGHIVTD